MHATLYTFGYLSTRAERIINELLTVKTPLGDVRYNPTSRRRQYTQDALKRRAGDLYVHIKDLGNELNVGNGPPCVAWATARAVGQEGMGQRGSANVKSKT